ncbi:MAG: helix-hairpin-helix domain-containing protein [Myxococcota bacterium]
MAPRKWPAGSVRAEELWPLGIMLVIMALTSFSSWSQHLPESPSASKALYPDAPPAPLEQGETLDLNRASAEELQRLPRIGPALAARIIAHRTDVGRFEGPEELVEVRGIGNATVARLRPFLRVDP